MEDILSGGKVAQFVPLEGTHSNGRYEGRCKSRKIIGLGKGKTQRGRKGWKWYIFSGL